jgi:hypothetical protein
MHGVAGLASAENPPASRRLSGPRVDVRPDPRSTPGRESLRNLWRDRRTGDRRHPHQRFLWHEIRARPPVGDHRFPQIGSALGAEVAAASDLSPELLGRVCSAARLAPRHRVVRAHREEQRSESPTRCAHRRSRSTSLSSRGVEIFRWKVWTLVDNYRRPRTLLHLLRQIATPLCQDLSTAPACHYRPVGGVLTGSSLDERHEGLRTNAQDSASAISSSGRDDCVQTIYRSLPYRTRDPRIGRRWHGLGSEGTSHHRTRRARVIVAGCQGEDRGDNGER